MSLFEHIPKDVCLAGERQEKRVQAAVYAIENLLPTFIHFIFIPPGMTQQISLDESNVRQIPETGGTPTILNTDQCRPPARVAPEDGRVLEYAKRYINEYLYLGGWAPGITTITERRKHSYLFKLMSLQMSVEEIRKEAETRHSPDDVPNGIPGELVDKW